MNAIVVENLSKQFTLPKRGKKGRMAANKPYNTESNVRAVDSISFEVKKGEIFGFLGPNGAGKTTTIRMLTGVLKPTTGKIKMFGLDAWSNQIAVKQVIGNVPEMANAYLSFSGWQNLMFVGQLYGASKEERFKRAKDLLEKFELYEKRQVSTKKYSKGMQQRLLLCMALMSDPQILFLDEPTSGLDVQSARIIKQIIREYNKRGVTIFITTHDMEVANELCDRIAIINRGKIISLDTPDNIRKLKQENQAINIYFANGVKTKDIEKLPTIKDVQEVKEGFHVLVENMHDSICELVEFAKKNNATIKHLNTHEPKLEEAFLKIIERGNINE